MPSVVSRVRAHPWQLDVIVARRFVACRASRSPQGSNDIVKEGGGDRGGFVVNFDDGCYHGTPPRNKRVLGPGLMNKMSYSLTVFRNMGLIGRYSSL